MYVFPSYIKDIKGRPYGIKMTQVLKSTKNKLFQKCFFGYYVQSYE
jgi:hypothetical protein